MCIDEGTKNICINVINNVVFEVELILNVQEKNKKNRFFSSDVASMSDSEVSDFRSSNNNIAVTNFNEKSDAPLLNPTPSFEHAFHNFPDVLETISGFFYSSKIDPFCTLCRKCLGGGHYGHFS